LNEYSIAAVTLLDWCHCLKPKTLSALMFAKCLPQVQDKDKAREYDRRDLKIKGIIEMRISDSLLGITQEVGTAYAAWKMLYQTFRSSARVCPPSSAA
jgi:hypothetical protein